MEELVKLCKDCRFYNPLEYFSADCLHPRAVFSPGRDLVTGEPPSQYHQSCRYMRSSRQECGFEATLFEPKETITLATMVAKG